MGTRAAFQGESGSRNNAALQKIERKRFPPIKGKSTIERFAEKCAFDPITGCVMWIGGQTRGGGHNEPYGRFWDGQEMVLAHRWAAQYIHGHYIHGLHVDHCCPAGPSTLCVEHVRPETAERNRELQTKRNGIQRCIQSLTTRQYWLFVWKGIEERPARIMREEAGVPWFDPPAWFKPFMDARDLDDSPF